MNKIEFLSALERELGALPPEERRDAMQYYKEYFEEAGPENEEAAAASLDSPQEIAAELLAASPNRAADASKSAATRAGAVAGACLLIFLCFVLSITAFGLLLGGICITAVSIYALTVIGTLGIAVLGVGLTVLGLGGLALGGAIKSGGQCRTLLGRNAYKEETK